MSAGHSFTSFAAKIKVGRRTLYDWCKFNPEFLDAYEIGYSSALHFYEKLMLDGIKGKVAKSSKGISPTLLIFALKTRFHAEYGRNEAIDVHMKDQPIDIANIRDPEELRKLVPDDYDLRAEYLKMKEMAEEGLRLAEALDSPNPFIDL